MAQEPLLVNNETWDICRHLGRGSLKRVAGKES